MGEEMIELLNCDCMEYMKGCEDNAFDLAILPLKNISTTWSVFRKIKLFGAQITLSGKYGKHRLVGWFGINTSPRISQWRCVS